MSRANISWYEVDLFPTSGTERIYIVFTGLDPVRSELLPDDTMLSMPKLNAWIARIVQELAVQETCGGSSQRSMAISFCKVLQVSKNQVIGTVRRFVVIWEHQERCISTCSGGLEHRKYGVMTMKRKNYHPQVSFSSKLFLNVRNAGMSC